jgi:hypothetical protein
MEMKYHKVCFYRYVKLLVLRITSAGGDSDLLFIIYYLLFIMPLSMDKCCFAILSQLILFRNSSTFDL